jgi:hypothetical protein
MTQVCSKCSHANPPEATYCYYDGVILSGHSVNGGPVQAGSQPFPSQFVFPTGQACRNFDQLAVACQQNWPAAVDLLRQGFLASFLGGIGRADLALAAQEAAKFPDQDRGLDQLLAKLPSQVLESPRLRVEPTEVNLGIMAMGANHSLDIHLINQGMRLLYGSIVSDCKWMTLGDAPGNAQKIFQYGGDGVIQVNIRGQHLRAGNKPLEGHLVVDSNGGSATITVRVEVPAKAFPNGVLAGATTPRQIAEKAHVAPKESAPLFEGGAVARWFADNGWIYPVQGPPASGVGAVQQFFEALGLSKAPKVDLTQPSLALQGEVGQSTQALLELKAQEKRPVYAHAVCDQPWLDVSKTVLSGRVANIVVLVPHIPDRPGDVLQATVTVTANGNQKFVVPVTLTIEDRPGRPYYAEVIPVSVPAASSFGTNAIPVAMPAQAPVAALPVAVAVPTMPAIALPVEAPVAAVPVEEWQPPPPAAPSPFAFTSPQPADQITVIPTAPYVPVPVAPAGPAGTGINPWTSIGIKVAIIAIPLLILFFFLLLLLIRDIFFAPQRGEDTTPIDPTPKLAVFFDDDGVDEEGTQNKNTMRFGLVETAKTKRKLTYSNCGRTNNTVLRIAGKEKMLGIPGEWKVLVRGEKLGDHGGKKSVWQYEDGDVKIQITQLVEIVPGDPFEYKPGKLKRYYDTCRVRYVLENKGKESVSVGLRVLIDTLIGATKANDGVPFTVPGQKGLVDRSGDYQGSAVPDFIQVLESRDLSNPGLVGFMNLKLGGGLEPPSRLLLTHWYPEPRWEIPERPIGDDSAVVIYWEEKDLRSAEKREIGFSYGLGSLSVGGGRLAITTSGSPVKDSDFTVVALVNNPVPGETVTLKLPTGLRLVEGDLKQAVPTPGAVAQSPVTWRIRADQAGQFTIEVQSSTGISQKKSITVRTKTIF